LNSIDPSELPPEFHKLSPQDQQQFLQLVIREKMKEVKNERRKNERKRKRERKKEIEREKKKKKKYTVI